MITITVQDHDTLRSAITVSLDDNLILTIPHAGEPQIHSRDGLAVLRAEGWSSLACALGYISDHVGGRERGAHALAHTSDAAALSRVATLLREDHRGLRSAVQDRIGRTIWETPRTYSGTRMGAAQVVDDIIGWLEGDATPLELSEEDEP